MYKGMSIYVNMMFFPGKCLLVSAYPAIKDNSITRLVLIIVKAAVVANDRINSLFPRIALYPSKLSPTGKSPTFPPLTAAKLLKDNDIILRKGRMILSEKRKKKV